jgi:hypothetical protein
MAIYMKYDVVFIALYNTLGDLVMRFININFIMLIPTFRGFINL